MKISLPFGKSEINETMEDYIRWRGDLSFAENPLNPIDNMILCELSYVSYAQVITDENPEGISLRECGQRIKEKNCYSLQCCF